MAIPITVLTLADYVGADIRNESLETEEMHLSLKEEMEPEVLATIDTAVELSRAHRYISQDHWRMAIIYMDHLGTKHHPWGALCLAKATAYKGMNKTDQALMALRSACNLDVQQACVKIRMTAGYNCGLCAPGPVVGVDYHFTIILAFDFPGYLIEG